jgi:hypothetical protein
MIERGEHLGFAGKARHAIGVLVESLREDFDSYVAIQFGVGGPPDFTHTALAQLGEHAVVTDRLLGAHRANVQAWYHFPMVSTFKPIERYAREYQAQRN